MQNMNSNVLKISRIGISDCMIYTIKVALKKLCEEKVILKLRSSFLLEQRSQEMNWIERCLIV